MALLTYGFLATAFAMVVVQNLSLFVGLTALQAAILGVQAAWLGVQYGDPALYWAAGMTLVIKGVAIPLFLRYIINRIRVLRVVDQVFTTKVSLLIAVGLTVVGYYATGTLGQGSESLAVALTTVLLGVFLMVSRRVAFTQVIGLLVMENGLFLAALATTRGLPVLVDAGIFFDVLVSILVTGILIYRINATVDTIDTQTLRRLRG